MTLAKDPTPSLRYMATVLRQVCKVLRDCKYDQTAVLVEQAVKDLEARLPPKPADPHY